MIIYLYGVDSYRRGLKEKSLLEAYRAKYASPDVSFFDFEDDPESWALARDFLSQSSLFVESKIAFVRNGTCVQEKEWVQVLKNYVSTPKTFVVISDFQEPVKAFRFLLESPVQSQAFPELEGDALRRFVDQEARTIGISFQPEAYRLFLNYLQGTSDRSWVLVHELKKIFYARFQQPVSYDNMRLLVPSLSRHDLYKVVRFFLDTSDYARTFPFLEFLFLQGEAPAHVFNLLAALARGSVIMNMAQYDISVKSGALEYEEALTDFLLRR